MYLTEKEIMSTHEALKQSYDQILSKQDEIKSFFPVNQERKFVFFGCGSSYMIAKCCERFFIARPDTAAVAIAGGDYLMNPDYYKETVKDSIIVFLSRSGLTTELISTADYIKANFDVKIVSITMKEQNDLADRSDLSIKLPWAYDNSVCQTRTVTNLFTACLMLTALCYRDDNLISDIRSAITENEKFKLDNRAALEMIGKKDFTDVVVLADGPLGGLAEEGALAFTEIALIPGSFFNLLDYRHGPIVLNNKNTLTIVALQSVGGDYQAKMIADLKAKGGIVVTVGEASANPYGADLHISTGNIGHFAAMGIYFIYVCQMIALAKALASGVNPDKPTGLNAYITL
jgi:fructoselysine-6-P-deglycase FrlB-like protein